MNCCKVKYDGVQEFSNDTNRRFFENRIPSSLDLLSYVADAQSPQPVTKTQDAQDKPTKVDTKGKN